jgi:hypothetical protein
MLSEQIGEATGTVSGTRVLSAEGEASKMEVSFRGRGELLGVAITDVGTFVQTVRPGGILGTESSNVLFLSDEGELASWTGFGGGRPTGAGFSSSLGGCRVHADILPQASASERRSHPRRIRVKEDGSSTAGRYGNGRERYRNEIKMYRREHREGVRGG